LDFQFKSCYIFLRSYGQFVARRKDAFEMKLHLQKKGRERLEIMPQKRIPEAALSIHVCNPKYSTQGRPPKTLKTIAGKRTNYLPNCDTCTLGMVKNFVLKKSVLHHRLTQDQFKE
jgi:hypothetical protein